jgi:hypothetical protein
MSEARFFAFNPRAARSLLTLGEVACVAATVWALYGLGSASWLAEARAGISVGLLLAFVYVNFRLRPRDGWGVLLTPDALVVARPLSGDAAQVPWSAVRAVGRAGKRRDVLVVLLDGDRRLLVPRHLFAGSQAFEALAAAVEERAPASRYDA